MIFRFVFIVFFCLIFRGNTAPPELTDKDLPRFPAVEPADAVKTIHVKPGFHVELAACEPNVTDPVALAFDENGRMFVVEMNDYSERRDERLGRVSMLEDLDNDGVYEKATVFARNLPWPTGVICYDGGIFVASSPDIIYLKDTDGDGKADVRKVVFTGFGSGKERLNVQALLNSFNWGLDNKIHGATAPNGGVVTNLAFAQKPLNLNGRDFYFDPRTMKLFSENGGGQYGFSYDSKGRKFVCSNSHHIQTMMYDARYAARNPFYAMPGALVDIAVDGPAAEVYRISPEEPWRVIRTKWRVSGIASGPIEGGGRSAGYFTGATGITIYRGDAFPEDFHDNAFTGDAGGNLVHRKKIYADGVGVKAERPADEQKVEFLASTDTWFRPVQSANAPDGTLYVIDMYREVIEHPWSLPEQIKKHLDLNSGSDRGRIYRVVPDNFKRPKPVRLGSASTKELVATLENPNGWHRDTAARLLFERQDKSAVRPLLKLAQNSRSPLARMHALYALDGLNALDQKTVLRALRDSDETVRQHAVQLAEKFLHDPKTAKKTVAALQTLASDPSINVRYQLAFTLGEMSVADKTSALAEILKSDATNSWMRAAALSSLGEGAGHLFAVLSRDENVTSQQSGQEFLSELVKVIGAKNQSNEVAGVVAFLNNAENPALIFPLVRALGDGLKRSGAALKNFTDLFQPAFVRAEKIAADSKADKPTRLKAIELLGSDNSAESGKTLATLLSENQSQAVQLAAVDSLGNLPGATPAKSLVAQFSTMTPRVRSATISVLLARPERISVLLGAIENKTVQASDLTSPQIKFLKNHRDKSIRAEAAKLFANVGTARRADVIKNYQPALALAGNAAHGKAIYLERCSSCHRYDGNGFALGPDFVTVKNMGKEKLLANILDPNSEVAPNYRAFEVETKDDESFIGLVVSETASSVTVRQAFGKENVILRSQIKKLQSQGQSLMPEGLEGGLSPQDFADLLEYISK
jgi:putative membrane-bound dehydrogenase-like protein